MVTGTLLEPARAGQSADAFAADGLVNAVLRLLPQAMRTQRLPWREVDVPDFDLGRIDPAILPEASSLGPAAKARLAAAMRDPKFKEALHYWYLVDNPDQARRLEFEVEIVDSRRPGVEHVELTGINDAGAIVGRYFLPGGSSSGFLRDAAGHTHLLGMDCAMAINNAGTVVGFNRKTLPSGWDTVVPMVCDSPPGPCRRLGFPGAGAALAIDDHGRIAGATSQPGGLFAFSQGLLFDLAARAIVQEIVMPVPFVQSTVPYGLNDPHYNTYLGGLVTGEFYDNTLARRGFEYGSGAYRSVDRVGASAVRLRGVNNLREIVGFECVPDPLEPARRRFVNRGLLIRYGRPFAYGSVGRAPGTRVEFPEFRGINNRSQIVGSFCDARGVNRGFVATPV